MIAFKQLLAWFGKKTVSETFYDKTRSDSTPPTAHCVVISQVAFAKLVWNYASDRSRLAFPANQLLLCSVLAAYLAQS